MQHAVCIFTTIYESYGQTSCPLFINFFSNFFWGSTLRFVFWDLKRKICDKGKSFPCDLESDYHDRFQVSAWLILGKEKKVTTVVWIIHTQPVLGETSQFSEKSFSHHRLTKDFLFTHGQTRARARAHTHTHTHTHTQLLIPVWAMF